MHSTHSSSNWPLKIDFRIFNFYIRGYSVDECVGALCDQYSNDSPEMFLMLSSSSKTSPPNPTSPIADNVNSNGVATADSRRKVTEKILSSLGKDFASYLKTTTTSRQEQQQQELGGGGGSHVCQFKQPATTTTTMCGNRGTSREKHRHHPKVNVASALLGSILMAASRCNASDDRGDDIDSNWDSDDDDGNNKFDQSPRNFLVEEVLEHYTIFRQLEAREEFLHDPRAFVSASVDAISKNDRRVILEQFYHLDPLFYRSAFGVPVFTSGMLQLHNHRLIARVLSGDYGASSSSSNDDNNNNNNNNGDVMRSTSSADGYYYSQSSSTHPAGVVETLLAGLTTTLSGGDLAAPSSSSKDEMGVASKQKQSLYYSSPSPSSSSLQNNNSSNNSSKYKVDNTTSSSSSSSPASASVAAGGRAGRGAASVSKRDSMSSSSSWSSNKYSTVSINAELQQQTVVGRQFSRVVTPILMHKFQVVMEKLQREYLVANASAIVVAPRQSFIDRQSENLVRIALLVFRGYSSSSSSTAHSNNASSASSALFFGEDESNSGRSGILSSMLPASAVDFFENLFGSGNSSNNSDPKSRSINNNNNNNDGSNGRTRQNVSIGSRGRGGVGSSGGGGGGIAETASRRSIASNASPSSSSSFSSAATNNRSTINHNNNASGATSDGTSNNNNNKYKNKLLVEFSSHFSVVDAIAEHFQLSSPLSWQYATLIFAAHHRLANAHLFQEFVLPSADIMQSLAHLLMTSLCTESLLFIDTELQEQVADVARLLSDPKVAQEIINSFQFSAASVAAANNNNNNGDDGDYQMLQQQQQQQQEKHKQNKKFAQVVHRVLQLLSRSLHFFCGNYSIESEVTLSSNEVAATVASPATTRAAPSMSTNHITASVAASAAASCSESVANTPTTMNPGNSAPTIHSGAFFVSEHKHHQQQQSMQSQHLHFSKHLLVGFVCELEKLFIVDEVTVETIVLGQTSGEHQLLYQQQQQQMLQNASFPPELQHHSQQQRIRTATKLAPMEHLQDVKNALRLIKKAITAPNSAVSSMSLGVATLANPRTFAAACTMLDVATVTCTMVQAASFSC